MIWYVRMSGQIVGWVVAANHRDAFCAALVKFPSWDFEPRHVEPRRRKRCGR